MSRVNAYVRYNEGEFLKTNFFFRKNLPGKTTGAGVFRVTDVYIPENNLRWEASAQMVLRRWLEK
jgi:hypothetical protein